MSKLRPIARSVIWRLRTTRTIVRWHRALKPLVAGRGDTIRGHVVISALVARLWGILVPVPAFAMTIDGNRHAITMSDHTELAGAVEVFVSGDYDIGASSDDVRRVIDLGANVGFATHYMRSRYPDAEIVALEPAPDAYRRLAANVEHLGWVTTLPLAIGVPGWVRMDLSLPSPERSPVSTDDAQGIRRISLQSLLVMLGWDEVDVLKVDIEGDEFMVLADTDTVQRARIVVGELHMDRAPPDFAGVETLLPGFVVDTISRSAGTAIFRAVRRNSLPGGAS